MKQTVATFLKSKREGKRLAMVTAYDYSMAQLVDNAGVDSILVGDSLGMVCLGYKDTLHVTMADMIHHTRAVSRGTQQALLVSDLPFMSYHVSVEQAVINAGRLVQEGYAEAVKLEGGTDVVPQVRAIVKAQIPVMGHIGLTPQSVNLFGGFKVQGREIKRAKQLIEDAKRLEGAGVFSIVLECVPRELAAMITDALSVPTIGIGAGDHCDGQVLVIQDMLDMYENMKPKFVKTYANAGEVIQNGIKAYVEEVKSGAYPDDAHSFSMGCAVMDELKDWQGLCMEEEE